MRPPWSTEVVGELDHALAGAEPERAVLALGNLQERAAPAVESIARFAESDANPSSRAMAVRALARIGSSNAAMVALIRLAEVATNVRAAAITELGRMGPAARQAVSRLAKIAMSTDRHLRLVALTALGNIGEKSGAALVAILAALGDTERDGIGPSQLHYNAMCILNQLAPTDSDLAAALLPARRISRGFDSWFLKQFPGVTVADRHDAPEVQPEEELFGIARSILKGCQLLARKRPF
jgi:hypothetical protein